MYIIKVPFCETHLIVGEPTKDPIEEPKKAYEYACRLRNIFRLSPTITENSRGQTRELTLEELEKIAKSG